MDLKFIAALSNGRTCVACFSVLVFLPTRYRRPHPPSPRMRLCICRACAIRWLAIGVATGGEMWPRPSPLSLFAEPTSSPSPIHTPFPFSSPPYSIHACPLSTRIDSFSVIILSPLPLLCAPLRPSPTHKLFCCYPFFTLFRSRTHLSVLDMFCVPQALCGRTPMAREHRREQFSPLCPLHAVFLLLPHILSPVVVYVCVCMSAVLCCYACM